MSSASLISSSQISVCQGDISRVFTLTGEANLDDKGNLRFGYFNPKTLQEEDMCLNLGVKENQELYNKMKRNQK